MAFEPRRTTMPRKRHKPEEIVAKLRQVDVLVSQGQSVAEAVRSIAVTEVTYYRWPQEFGGLKSDQVKRLKDLETENTRLRRAISDLTLDKLILQEAPLSRQYRAKARKCFGAIVSCSAISSAAAQLLAAFSSTFGKAERINTGGKEERGAMASSVLRPSSRSA